MTLLEFPKVKLSIKLLTLTLFLTLSSTALHTLLVETNRLVPKNQSLEGQVLQAVSCTHYVDNQAPTDGNGSLDNPWNNIAGHVNDLEAGDTMCIRGDSSAPGRVYTEEPIRLISWEGTNSGTSLAPITIRSYSGEYVILKTITPPSRRFTIELLSVNWWTIDGLKFDGDYDTLSQISIDNSGHLRILNCELYQNGGDGAILFSDDNAGNDVAIDNCTIYDTFKGNDDDSAGILISGGTNIIIKNNEIYDCRGDSIVSCPGSTPITDFIIEDNHLYTTLGKCSENAIDLKKGSGVVRRNKMHGFRHCDASCGGTGNWGGPAVQFHEEATDITFENNEIYDSALGLRINAVNIRVVNNLFYDIVLEPDSADSAKETPLEIHHSSDVTVINNTFIDVPGWLFNFSPLAIDIVVKNNLAYSTNSIRVDDSSSTIADYNGWFNTTQRIEGDNDTIGDDPLLTADYHLTAGSPAIDGGVDLGYPYSGVAPDLGAFEYGGIPEPTPTTLPGTPTPTSFIPTPTPTPFVEENDPIRTMVLTSSGCYQLGDGAVTLASLECVFENAIKAFLGLAAIILFVVILVAGFKYVTSGGDPKAVQSAKMTLTYAIGGMVLIALSFLILQFISVFTGADVTDFTVAVP